MKNTPLLMTGQLYYIKDIRTTVVITKLDEDYVTYKANGVYGHLEIEQFVDAFLPMNYKDVDNIDCTSLQSFTKSKLSSGVKVSVDELN